MATPKRLPRVKGIQDPGLYAVVSHTAPPAARKVAVAEIREQKNAEFQLKSKIDRAANDLDKLEDQVKAISKQIAALERSKAIRVERIARIEIRIIDEMESASLNKADGWKRLFTTRPGPPAVQIDDLAKIPAEYIHEEIIRRPEKNAIKAALALGFVVSDINQVPAAFKVGETPNAAAIRAALDGGVDLAGVTLLEEIPGVHLSAKIVLSRK